MFFTGCTPLDIYRYFTKGAHTAKEKGAEFRPSWHASAKSARPSGRPPAPPHRMRRARKRCLPRWKRKCAGMTRRNTRCTLSILSRGRKRSSIDIDLGDGAMAQSTVKHEEKPHIGPGGTFGMYPDPYAGDLPHGEVLDAPFVDKLGLAPQGTGRAGCAASAEKRCAAAAQCRPAGLGCAGRRAWPPCAQGGGGYRSRNRCSPPRSLLQRMRAMHTRRSACSKNRRRQTRAISKPSCATMQTCW